MKKVIFIFICSFMCLADDKERAIKTTQKAILKYPVIRKYRRAFERKMLKKIPIEKETLGVIGGVGLSASKGYLDTRVIKKMDIKVFDAKIRPNVKYNFKSKEKDGTIQVDWSF
jgi:hypothetical protein